MKFASRSMTSPTEPGRGPRRQTRRLASALMAGAVLAAPLAAVSALTGSVQSAAAATSTCPSPSSMTSADQASTTGISAKSVTVGNVSIISGPVPGLFEGAPTGVKAYFAYINSQGGVDGRKLDVQSFDTGFSGEQNGSETQQAESSDFAMVGNFSLFDTYGCPTLAENPAFPDVSVTLDPTTNSLPNDFSAQPLAVGAGLGGFKYIRAKYPKAIKVGTIISTTSTAVSQWEGEEAALKHVGFKIAYAQKVGPLTSNFTTEVIKMRNAGVQVVYLTALDWQVAAILSQEMAQQNWHPTVVLSGGPIYADQFISHGGGAADTDGDWITQGQALYLGQDASAIPADKEFLKWVKQVNPGWTPDLFTLYGWSSAQLFVQALKAAGPHPTRGSVLAQLAKITSFNASGLLAPTNPAKKLPSDCFVAARIENGKYVRVKPTGSGFTCSGGYYYASGHPTATS